METETLTSLISSPVLISVAVLLLLYCTSKFYFRNKGYNYPPGPRGMPFFGYFPNLGNNLPELMENFSKEYGDVFTITIAGRRYVVLNSFESIKEAYITNGSYLSHRPEGYSVFASLFGNKALAFVNGEEWRIQRKLFTSALKSIGPNNINLESRIYETTNIMIEKVNNLKSEPVDLYGIFANSIIDVVGNLVCGEALATTEPETADLILKDSREAFGLAPGAYGFLSGIIIKLIAYVFTGKEQKMAEIRQRQFNIMNRFIQGHKETFDPDNVRDYIDSCLKEKLKFGEDSPESQWFSLEHLAANMFVFYVGGTDSTSSAMYFATFMMVKYPDIQTKCREELDEIVGRDAPIRFQDKERLPYIEAVINDVLRYTTIAATLQARCTTNPIILQGFHIPPKTDILANLWSVTRDKNLWTNPDIFDPGNFFEKDIPRDLASLPFSAGKRICPGERLARMEIFLVLTTLLQKFVLSLSPNKNTNEQIESKFNRVLAPFKVIATPR